MILHNVDYHIIDRCNLNCVSCGHFAPLVPKSDKGVSVSQAIRDLTLLKNVTEGYSDHTLTITGGEFTLNSQFQYILEYAVELFGNRVKLWSNGSNVKKLLSISDFVKSNDLILEVSDYPGIITMEVATQLEEAYGHNIIFTNRLNEFSIYYFFRGFLTPDIIFDVNNQDDIDEILNCYARSHCTQLKNGRLYLCQYAAHLHILQDYFKSDFKIPRDDGYVDLSTCTWTDVEDLIDHWIPNICLHCLDLKRLHGKYKNSQPWGKSKLELDEWIPTTK